MRSKFYSESWPDFHLKLDKINEVVPNGHTHTLVYLLQMKPALVKLVNKSHYHRKVKFTKNSVAIFRHRENLF